jgi:glycosyltransferase involved in cell wall biosynthesis
MVGSKDVIRENVDGFVVKSRDVRTLKEKIAYLYKNRETCRQMGQEARQRVINDFTWSNYGWGMINAYRTLLAK